MKECIIWSIMILMALPIITACRGDDDSDGNISNKSKHISKIIEETDGSIRESIFTYDTQDRVIEMKMTTNSSSTTDGVYAKTYQYGETLIIEKEVLNGNPSYDQSTGYPRTHTYTLSNGLIVKDTETRNGTSRYILFTYDNDGKLKTISEYDNGDKVKSLSWSNGMLSKMEQYAENFISGRLVYQRFSPHEQHGCAAGGATNVIASLLAGAETGTDSTNPPALGDYERERQQGARQETAIERWARAVGVWTERVDDELPRATPDIYLSDMHDENVIRSNRTHTIFVIDCDIRINTPELRQGGTRILTNAIEFV